VTYFILPVLKSVVQFNQDGSVRYYIKWVFCYIMSSMDIDFSFDNELVVVGEKESRRDKQKMRKKSMQLVRQSFRKCTGDRLFGKMGEC